MHILLKAFNMKYNLGLVCQKIFRRYFFTSEINRTTKSSESLISMETLLNIMLHFLEH